MKNLKLKRRQKKRAAEEMRKAKQEANEKLKIRAKKEAEKKKVEDLSSSKRK